MCKLCSSGLEDCFDPLDVLDVIKLDALTRYLPLLTALHRCISVSEEAFYLACTVFVSSSSSSASLHTYTFARHRIVILHAMGKRVSESPVTGESAVKVQRTKWLAIHLRSFYILYMSRLFENLLIASSICTRALRKTCSQ